MPWRDERLSAREVEMTMVDSDWVTWVTGLFDMTVSHECAFWERTLVHDQTFTCVLRGRHARREGPAGPGQNCYGLGFKEEWFKVDWSGRVDQYVPSLLRMNIISAISRILTCYSKIRSCIWIWYKLSWILRLTEFHGREFLATRCAQLGWESPGPWYSPFRGRWDPKCWINW